MQGPPPWGGAQTQLPSKQSLGSLQSTGGQLTHSPPLPWAKAGVRMLVTIGAVQTTAAPAPIRLSILRREIRDPEPPDPSALIPLSLPPGRDAAPGPSPIRPGP
jgi:hypothetical protein